MRQTHFLIKSKSGVFFRNVDVLSEFYFTDKKLIESMKSLSELINISGLPTPAPASTCVVVTSGGILLRHPGLGKKGR